MPETETEVVTDPPADPKGKKKKDPPVEEPKKVELTEAELQARIDAALAADRDKAAAKAKKEKDEADRAAAEAQGKFKELADQERAKAETLAAENRTLKLTGKLRDHLAEKYPAYVGNAKYILPMIPADTPEDGWDKAIAVAAETYVKDNPREQAKGGGAPAQPGGKGTLPDDLLAAARERNNKQPPRFSTLGWNG